MDDLWMTYHYGEGKQKAFENGSFALFPSYLVWFITLFFVHSAPLRALVCCATVS